MAEATQIVRSEIAPGGVLRAAINFGNPVLTRRGADGGPGGLSVELARLLAERLDLALEFVIFEAAGKVVACAGDGVWDIGFLAVDPARAGQIAFSDPYVKIEAACLVWKDSPYRAFADVDQPGVRIAVGRGAAYELALSRDAQHAELVRADTSDGAIALFHRERLEAVAGIRPHLKRFAEREGGLRLLPETLTEIRQAMVAPAGRPDTIAYLNAFLAELKASGFIAEALRRYGQTDAEVA